jgi:transcriptional regulator with XRE-family HTH domain
MAVPETWSAYVRRVSGGLTQAQVAEKIGVAASNVGRWVRGEPGMPRAETVITFAKVFNQPVMEAMIAAGYFTEAEAMGTARTPLTEYSTEELFDELKRRTLNN